MDSSVVNREIRSVIRPLLRDVGFTQFTARSAWRYLGEKIDVVHFQSFNSYLANGLGCTTYSFCLRLGCSFDAIPRSDRIKRKDGLLRPEEYYCHFRHTLEKTIRQPNLERTDVWYVDPSGNNVDIVIADAKKAILEIGLAWFSRFGDMKEVLRSLLRDPDHAFGGDPSPMRNLMTGFIAYAMGEKELARDRIQKVLKTESYKELRPKMHALLEAMDNQSATPGKLSTV